MVSSSYGTITEGEDVWITYTVLPKIEGNNVLTSDTVCFGLEALPFNQDPDFIRGGALFGTDFTYNWIKSTDGGTVWSDASGTRDAAGYVPPGLDETTIYSRVIKSGVCDDTSNFVTVTVLPAVGNNTISQDTILCFNQTPDELIGTLPTGGDAARISYKWEEADALAGPYSEVATTQHYAPPALTVSKYYRRVFYSGIHDACKDTTAVLVIDILPLITDNNLLSTEDTICELSPLDVPVSGLQPTGGDGAYTYIWQVSEDQVFWGDSATYSSNNDLFNSLFLHISTKRYRSLALVYAKTFFFNI